jgi:hypothetical protein
LVYEASRVVVPAATISLWSNASGGSQARRSAGSWGRRRPDPETPSRASRRCDYSRARPRAELLQMRTSTSPCRQMTAIEAFERLVSRAFGGPGARVGLLRTLPEQCL